jgi:hypothetical protein
VDLLRKRIIPVLAFVLLAAKTTSQLNDHLWTAWLGAALIVLAGLRGAGKRWMYFVLPPVASTLFLIFILWHSYATATSFFHHRPAWSEFAAFVINKWQREYGIHDPYWLTIGMLYFISSYNAGWLYGSWSMLEPGAARLAPNSGAGPITVGVAEGTGPKQPLIQQPFRILALILAGLFLLSLFLAR